MCQWPGPLKNILVARIMYEFENRNRVLCAATSPYSFSKDTANCHEKFLQMVMTSAALAAKIHFCTLRVLIKEIISTSSWQFASLKNLTLVDIFVLKRVERKFAIKFYLERRKKEEENDRSNKRPKLRAIYTDPLFFRRSRWCSLNSFFVKIMGFHALRPKYSGILTILFVLFPLF